METKKNWKFIISALNSLSALNGKQCFNINLAHTHYVSEAKWLRKNDRNEMVEYNTASNNIAF